jgi:hypothetical protein
MPYSEQSTKRTIKESPTELHTSSEKPHTYKGEGYEMLHLFGYSKRIQVRNMGMIVTEIQKAKYTYVVSADDWRLIRKHKEVVMYYDLEDLDRVQLFTAAARADDEQYLCEATEQKAVQWHGPNKDGAAMGKARKRLAEIRRQNDDDMAEYQELAGVEGRVLLGIGSSKEDREKAETAWLYERAQTRPQKPQKTNTTEDDDDGSDIVFTVDDIRKMY